ncbi:MAG: BspA family leucine-rich repeat surface protein [Allomuricauda sp.]
MKLIKSRLAILAILFLWSCSSSDSPEPPQNGAPKIQAQAYTVSENISDTQIIGTIVATDPDGDTLSYNISTNDGDLFEITTAGELSLAAGKSLNYATATQHQITVSVTDGSASANGQVTINVTEAVVANASPVAQNQNFEANEDILDTENIGTVSATDADGDNLTYSIVANDNDLFEITTDGMLSLAPGQLLDFENVQEHNITISVSDGVNTPVEFTVTITVLDNGLLSDDPASFITKWQTVSDGQSITIGTNSGYSYDYTVDWGDGTIETLTNQNPLHTYATAGVYTISIKGQFPAIRMLDSNVESRAAIIEIVQWGTGAWQSFEYGFYFCENMIYSATDTPDLTQVSNMYAMFRSATSFNGNIGGWSMGNVTNIGFMFWGATSFNQDIGGWDVSQVTNMGSLFSEATSFNQDISGWNTGNVTDMSFMFKLATSFNQDLSGWNVANVTDMNAMFRDAAMFNADISGWSTGNVVNMNDVFRRASSFDQDLGSWNIGSIQFMGGMLTESGLSSVNYSATLKGWAAQGDAAIPDGITLDAIGLDYCDDLDTDSARNTILIGNNGWTINDGNPVACP